jgi:hypothetical protein
LQNFSTFIASDGGRARDFPQMRASFSPSGWYTDWTGTAPMGDGLAMPNNALQLLALPCVLLALLLL